MELQTIAVSAITSIFVTPATLELFPKLFGGWWIERVKKNYNKELEEFRGKLQQQQKAIDSLTTRALYVSRTQFDTEFTAMKEVSQQLGKLMLAFRRIHPVDVGEDLDEAELLEAANTLRVESRAFLEKL